MAVSEEKTRVLVTIANVQKEMLDELAGKDRHSLSNLCAKIIADDLDSIKEANSS